MNSRDYWIRREAAALRSRITDEKEYNKQLAQIYQDMLDACQREIDSFYGRYASDAGITIAEAKRRIAKADIEELERKAARYVRERNFSEKANEELKLYNAMMKINRLEMLKANIWLELIAGHDELEKYMESILQGRTADELRRQAGILGETVRNNAQNANAIVNASFHNAKFSDRIWAYQDLLRAEVGRLLQSGLIQGKNPRALARELRKTFDVSRYNSERLMRTELARVQTEAQKQSFERNGFDWYEFICNQNGGRACPICQGLNGKHFKVADMMPGTNAPPMHPNCRCSTAAWEDDEEYEAWLDYLDKGGTTEDWEQRKKQVAKSSSSGIMKLPRYKDAVIPKAKFTQYALNPDKDPDKAKAFEQALGYTMDNADDLIKQIYEKLSEYEAVEKGDRGWGMTYQVIMNIAGPNGKTAKVLTAWVDDKNNGEMRLTTVHVDD